MEMCQGEGGGGGAGLEQRWIKAVQASVRGGAGGWEVGLPEI